MASATGLYSVRLTVPTPGATLVSAEVSKPAGPIDIVAKYQGPWKGCFP